MSPSQIEPVAIVLAAGKGTRMKSELPKVLVQVCGRPMIHYVLKSLREAGIKRILVVVGYRSELVRRELSDEACVEFVEQSEQLGTGHAVMACRQALANHEGPVLVVAGDSPMLQASSLRKLLGEFVRTQPACLLGTAHKAEPQGLGRIVRDQNGDFLAIVEEKDATPAQRAITEVNMSTYLFDCVSLMWALNQLTTENVQREYYLTDCPQIMRNAGKTVLALPALEHCEALSINTIEELAVVEQEMRQQ